MTKDQVRQQKKNQALNEIRKIFHPLAKNNYENYSGESYLEQDGRRVQRIIENLEKELNTLKKQT